MISLRQHIFSLVAVFVALAIGIAAGSTVVRGPLLDSTRARLESAEKLIEDERSENDVLAAEVAQLDDLGAEGPAQLLTGRLGSSPVLLVVAGDVDRDVVDGVVRSLSVATTGFVGELRLDAAVFDPEAAARVAGDIGAGNLVTADSEPTDDQVQDVGTEFGHQVATLLDQVAASTPSGQVGAAMNTAFGDLEDAGLVDLLRVTTREVEGERLDIVVLTDRNLAHDPATVLQSMMTVPADAAATPLYLVAEVGRIAQDNDQPVPSFVGSIRDSGRLRDEFSTVDNAETILGWIAIVLGLVAAEGGQVGQYGFRDGADAPIPRVVP